MSSNLPSFQLKWHNPPAHVTERQAELEHFNDLCRLFGVPAPGDGHQPDYTFERSVQKLTGGAGFADVWKRGAWAWRHRTDTLSHHAC